MAQIYDMQLWDLTLAEYEAMCDAGNRERK